MLDEAGLPLPDALQRVMISPHAQYRGLFRGLIRHLHGLGSKICIVTPDPQREDYWRKATADLPGVEFARNDRRYSVVREPVADEAALFKRAADYEAQLGVTINQLAVRDRHLGRGYAPGGFFHPRSQMSERSSYAQMVAAFVAELDFWAAEFERFKPTLVVNCGELAWRRAVQTDVPYRVLAGSRTENLFQWSEGVRFENARIRLAYKTLNGPLEAYKLERPYRANEVFVAGYESQRSLVRLVRLSARSAAQFAYWNLRGFEKAKGYFLTEHLASVWRPRRAWRQMTGSNTRKLVDLAGASFVFFPLQTEPEAALQGLSPEYLFQLEAIISLSRDLPAGTLLVVKDTPVALGRRPRDFYRQILELKNVAMLDIRTRGVDVVNAASAIATICGTAGFEGAIIGKPVIVFGQHNTYDFLDHVFKVGRDGSLRDGLHRSLSPSFDGQKAKVDGARYLAAVKAVSFRLEGWDIKNPENCSAVDVGEAAAGLSDSLGTRWQSDKGAM